MVDDETLQILRMAQYTALDEIVDRAVNIGRAIQRNEVRLPEFPSIFAAVDAYYTARSAGRRLEEEE